VRETQQAPGSVETPQPGPWQRSPARGYGFAAAIVAAATAVSLALLGRIENLNLVMIYLLGVVLVATRYGRGPSALAAVASVVVFDFFLVPPHLTFAVSDTQYLVTFAVMLVVGLLVSSLAARVREVAEMALQREERTLALYAVSRELGGLRDPREVAAAGALHVGQALHGEAVVLLAGDGDTEPGPRALCEPMEGTRSRLGLLIVERPASAPPLTPEQRDLLTALARLIAAPLERAQLAAEAEQARVAAEGERLRSTLLRSVSHDLRTPLTAITGAASALLEQPPPEPAVARELTCTVLEEADRLNRLVGNLLDMTRLEAGTLEPKREWASLEELVGSAIARVEREAGARRISARVDPDLPLVALDAVLVEQALVNLLENALRHGGTGAVEVSAGREGERAVVEVRDEGPGFPPQQSERIFEKFHRAAGGSGAGLGLAIARAIVTAHGGTIGATLPQPRGACFRVELPLGAAPSHPPPEEAA